MNDLKYLPSVDNILKSLQADDLISHFGRRLTLDSVRFVLDEIRKEYKPGDVIPGNEDILKRVSGVLENQAQFSLKEVINATGVILHTNLGRAPLGKSALKAINSISSGYSNLEYDLQAGKRGSRSVHAERLLVQLTGAEAALVVNNNAAAVLLCLSALAKGKSVVISRSQLVEIGGGFRVPDVMKQSGARLVEIGTTNRVHVRDYQEALENPSAMIFHAHHSNFQLVGFTSEPSLGELSIIAREHQVLLLDDLGSGALVNTELFGLSHEPTVQESLAAGADVVCFSGDKLLGGPQAGIIAGKAELLKKIKSHPLARAVRADKLCLAALTATLWEYMKESYTREIPVWQMIARTESDLYTTASKWRDFLNLGDVRKGFSTIGGGSMPGENIPTYLLSISIKKPEKLINLLRSNSPAIIARIEDDLVLFDPRTVLPDQEVDFLDGLAANLKNLNHHG